MTDLKIRLLSLFLAICTLLPFASCNSGNSDGATTTPEVNTEDVTSDVTTTEKIDEPYIPDGIILAGGDVSGACYVIGKGSESVTAARDALVTHCNSVVKGAAAVSDAENTSDGAYNIVISVDASSEKAYSVSFDGKNVRLTAKSDEFVDDAVDYFRAFSRNGDFIVLPDTYSFASDEGPEVLTHSPEKYYYYEDVYTPTLVYTYSAVKVDTAKSRLLVGGRDCTDKATWENGKVTLKNCKFDAGDYTVLVSLADKDGNVKVFETYFSCGDGSVMNLYSGELHAHTSDSDGVETVELAYEYARDVAKLDFFAVTDHSNSFDDPVYKGRHQTNADNFNDPGKFVALYGYEQTYNINTGYFGHLNTINYGTLTKRELSLTDYYKTVGEDPNAIIMFNHPGYRWGNFLEYGFYSEEYDKVVDLAEIKGKSYDEEYALSLTKGWHVSPMYNEDNHSANWGNAYEYCGYALAPSLTRQNILEALKKNRTYTTTDKSLKIYYSINGEWMGSVLDSPDELNVKVTLSTEKDYGLGTVSLIGEDNIVVARATPGSEKTYVWELTIDPEYDYYYIKVEAGDSKTWCVTAPVWVENREELTVESLTHSLVLDKSGSEDYRISATLKNSSDKAMTDVQVNFYTTSLSGFVESGLTPNATVRLDSIGAGESVTVTADVKYNASTPRVYAVVKGKCDGKAYGAVKYMELSNLYITEIVPQTISSDAFEFFELYNNSDVELDLSKFTMRYYYKAGAKAADLKLDKYTWKLTGKIAPHSTMVVWVVKESSTLTVADFNQHYGTSLVEGKDIVRMVGNNLPHAKPVQLEIIDSSSRVVARIWYNWANATNVAVNTAIIFKTPLDCTLTCQVYKSKLSPSPGKLDPSQIPETVK